MQLFCSTLDHATFYNRVIIFYLERAGYLSQLGIQEYKEELNFSTDAQTSPNHHAFVVFVVYLEVKGEPLTFILDIVEVAKSHTGLVLAQMFAQLLADFGIKEKVSMLFWYKNNSTHTP